MNQKKYINLLLSCIAIIGFYLQLNLFVSDSLIYILFLMFTLSLAILIVINLKDRDHVSHHTLIKRQIKLLSHTTTNVVMFGGDLSWSEDDSIQAAIQKITYDSRIVEVFLPENKLTQTSPSLNSDRIKLRIKTLQSLGATVYTYPFKDYHFRCVLLNITPSSHRTDVKAFFTHKLHNNRYFRYKITFFTYQEQEDVCEQLIMIYDLLKEKSTLVT